MRRILMERPVSRGQELELDVDALAYGASGVARLDGFVVFVERALPGDRVLARVTRVKRSHAEAEALEILAPGPERVAAPCAHYPACGGCRVQDLAYAAQARMKETQVRDSLARIGGLRDVSLEPIVPATEPFGYRNKMEYAFTATAEGAAPSLHRRGRFDEMLAIERCWLASTLGNAVRDAARAWAREEGLTAYEPRREAGMLRNLVVREGRATGQVLVLLVTAPGEVSGLARLVERLRAFPEVRSVHHAVNSRPTEVTNLPTELLYGEPAIEEEILGLRLLVGPTSFLQPNTAMCERLYAIARDYAALEGGEAVLDLYCGIGSIGLMLAPRARGVCGIELSEEAIALARQNARRNGIANAEFVVGDVAAALTGETDRPDVAIVDPPRAGLAPKALARVAGLEVSRLVYVSCNPATLARDAKTLLDEFGYRLTRVRPVDMFPHTFHIETVALFERS